MAKAGETITVEVKVLRELPDGRVEVDLGGGVQTTLSPENVKGLTRAKKGADRADDAEDVPPAKAARK